MLEELFNKLAVIQRTVSALVRYQLLKVRCSIGRKRSHSSANRQLLLLAWQFPPQVTGGVYRPLSFARYAAKRGWNVTVLCSNAPDKISPAGQYLLEQLPVDVRILRVKPNDETFSYAYFPKLDGGFANAISSIERVVLQEDLHPNVILASGPPFHNFLVGYHLAKFFDAPLVLDYRDEWTLCPFDFVRSSDFDRKWEKCCLEKARSVICTTHSFTEQAKTSFPDVAPGKYLVIPNGVEISDIGTKRKGDKRNTEPNGDIAFLGYLGTHTPPNGFVDTLQQVFDSRPDLLTKIRLHFVGERSPSAAQYLDTSPLRTLIKTSGQISKQEALQVMGKSSALLVLNPIQLQRYIPGKLFDYLASGTSLLVYGDGGEVGAIVRELNAGIIIPESDPMQLEQALNLIFSDPPRADPIELEAWLSRHSRESNANRLLNHLETLLP